MTAINQYFPQSVSHPGETLEEKLQEMGMGPKEFSIRTGKPEKTIFAIKIVDNQCEMNVFALNCIEIISNFQ